MIQELEKIVKDACKKETNYFGYGIWENHIVNVVKYGILMAEKIGADKEIVQISALLHDYASIIDYNLYRNHHIHSANEAEKLLRKFNYPQNKIDIIKDCITSHRGSEPLPKKSKEAVCLADADGMAHFDSIGSLYYLAFFSHKMDINGASNWLRKKLGRSWNKLSAEAKEIVKEKYKACKLILNP